MIYICFSQFSGRTSTPITLGGKSKLCVSLAKLKSPLGDACNRIDVKSDGTNKKIDGIIKSGDRSVKSDGNKSIHFSTPDYVNDENRKPRSVKKTPRLSNPTMSLNEIVSSPVIGGKKRKNVESSSSGRFVCCLFTIVITLDRKYILC